MQNEKLTSTRKWKQGNHTGKNAGNQKITLTKGIQADYLTSAGQEIPNDWLNVQFLEDPQSIIKLNFDLLMGSSE